MKKKKIIHQVSQYLEDASSITFSHYYCVLTMIYSYSLSVFLLLFSPVSVASKTMTSSSSTTIVSCLAEYNYDQSDCYCQYYQKSQCKPIYYNNNKEGASYRPKDQGWDDTCATCCCLCKFLLYA